MNGNFTNVELAEKVGVTPKTVGNWIKDWKELKAAKTATKDEIIARYLRQINSILKLADDEERTTTDAEADKISKLNKAMEAIDKEIGLSIFIQVFQEYNSFLLPLDAPLARNNNKFQDKFLQLKASGRNGK